MTERMSPLNGLVALVTGGTSGIGAATAALLADQGATVVAASRTASEARFHLRCDVTNDDELQQAFERIGTELGRLDVLVNSAGIGSSGLVSAQSRADWAHVLDVNVAGTARTIAHAIPLLRESPAASVVNVSSVLGRIGVPQRALYSASKGAITAMTRALAADHLTDGIRFNCVAPGTTETPWLHKLLANSSDPAAAEATLRNRQPQGQFVQADDVAHAIAHLASPESASTNGHELVVDRGLSTLR